MFQSLLGPCILFGLTQAFKQHPNEIGPSIILRDGHILRTRWHTEATAETREAFEGVMPFQSFLFHTVSSGHNLVFLMPRSGDQFWKSPTASKGLHARSSSEPGTMFFRHDQMCVLTYGKSQDHASFMPPVLVVIPEDLPALTAFGAKVWEGQLRSKDKHPFILTFTAAARPIVPPHPHIKSKTGVTDAVAVIQAKTWEHWLAPPQELVQLMSTGDAKGLEGTEGYIFPPMVIGNGVFMVLCTYAHSGLLNILASVVGQGVQEDRLNQQLKLLVHQLGEQNLPYLRSLGLDMVCECFDHFFTAWNRAETISGVQSLVSSISLFGALMHGWLVYLFPYRLGVELRRPSHPSLVPKVTNVPNVCDFSRHQAPSLCHCAIEKARDLGWLHGRCQAQRSGQS